VATAAHPRRSGLRRQRRGHPAGHPRPARPADQRWVLPDPL